MQIEGSATFAAPPERIYSLFTDPSVLRKATPGCQSLEEVSPGVFNATLKVGVAGISGTYQGKLEMQEQQPPNHYKLVVEGSGAPGYMSGTASFDFKAAPNGQTEVRYLWEIQVGGLVASVGQRVLGGVSKMLIGQFMEALKREIAA